MVGICTGHGLKDPDIITRQTPTLKILPAKLSALEAAIFEK